MNFHYSLKDRIISCLLTVILVFTSFNFDGFSISVKADENINIIVTANGQSIASDQNVSFDYGKTISLGIQGDIIFTPQYYSIRKEGSEETDEYDPSTIYAPGTYYVGYYYYEDECSGDFKFTINNSKLGVAKDLSWYQGKAAEWSAVFTDKNGNTLTCNANYEVSLLKDGAVVATKKFTANSNEKQILDFKSDILKNGAGVYTYSVTAIPDGANAEYYENSDTVTSTDYIKAVSVNLRAESGIASVSPTGESTILFIPKTGTNLSQSISAVAEDNWSFDSWSTDNAALTIDSPSSSSAMVSIGQDYDGDTSILVTASATEHNKPVISGFSAINGTPVKIEATAEDNQSGLAAYAFSTETDADNVSWVNLDEVATAVKNFDFVPTESGSYYFYAKDKCGNVAVSDSPIVVNKVIFNNYYSNNVKNDNYSMLFVGDVSITFPDLSGTSPVVRKGYTFEGWYRNSDYSGLKYEGLSDHLSLGDQDVVFYGKWAVEDKDWVNQLQPLNENYKGADYTVSAELSATTADVNYILFKKNASDEFVKVAESADGSFNIRNVSESGTYRIDAVVSYIDDEGITKNDTLQGTPAQVTIKPVSLSVNAKNVTITYGDDVPVYVTEYEGLVGDDITDNGASAVNAGSLSCDYKKGDDCGSYKIIFEDSYTSDNYEIEETEGTLTVEAKDLCPDGNPLVTVTLDKDSYEYTGHEINPVVTVTYNGEELPAEYYDVEADEKVNAGTHTLTITFKNNYKGLITKDFVIGQKVITAFIKMSGWTYGKTPESPVLIEEGLPSGMKYTVDYYYLPGEVANVSISSGGVNVRPSDAGTYTVYAVVKDTDGNYADIVTNPVTFVVEKRKITITAKSATWEYDGNPQHCSEYVITDADGNVIHEDQVFVDPKESFSSITVDGTIKDVVLDENGENVGVLNVVSYVLSAATKADNYEIITKAGVLKVTPTKLNSPANVKWDPDVAGLATWVPITKTNLKVVYEVKLYRHDDGNPEGVEIATYTTEGNEITHGFSDIIHQQIETDSNLSFSFTVTTIPNGGLAVNNYDPSDESARSSKIHTVTIKLSKKNCSLETEDQKGLASIEFTGDAAGKTSYTLISGESVGIKATAVTGYSFAAIPDEHYANILGIIHPLVSDYDKYFSTSFGGDVDHSITGSIRVAYNLTESLSEVYFTASTEDHAPWHNGFSASNREDLSGVDVTCVIGDGIGITKWAIEQVEAFEDERDAHDANGNLIYDEKGNIVKEKYTNYRRIGTIKWNDISNPDGSFPKEYTINTTVKKPGLFRVVYTDRTGSDGHFWYGIDTLFSVYEISFDKGDTDDNTHSMLAVYKLANTEITLPENVFEKEGYHFKNWQGANTGISGDKAKYTANQSDVLVAQWSNKEYAYTVNYYYMDTEGNYPDTPDATEVFYGEHGEVVSVDDAAIQKARKNYSIDYNPGVEDYETSITLTGEGQVLNIYYGCGQYKITYKFTKPGETEETSVYKTFTFGQTIVEYDKPVVPGYDFIGWNYEGFGSAPETMPAQDLIATGEFVAQPAKYTVVYHLETVGEGDTHTEKYETNDSFTKILNGKQGDTIKAYSSWTEEGKEPGALDVVAEEIEGFDISAVVISKGAPLDDTSLPEGANATAKTGVISVVDEEYLYINYYCTRQVYDLTLEVWKDNRELLANKIYSKSVSMQYGQDIDEITKEYEDKSYYDNLSGFNMPEDYRFTSYTDYSCGNRPTTMPAGSVTVIRDVVVNATVEYKVEVYFEKTAIGSFDLMTTLNYETVVGQKIKIVPKKPLVEEADTTYLTFDVLKDPLFNSNFYTYVSTAESVEEGIVKSGETLVLKVFFERIKTKLNVDFYYGNSATDTNKSFVSFQLQGKWGSTYEIDPLLLFDEVNDVNWYKNSSFVKSVDVDDVITKAENVVVKDITDSKGASQPGLTYDFRKNNYLVSYQCFYYFFDKNDNNAYCYPSHTFTTIGTGTTYEMEYKKGGEQTSGAGINDKIKCYFGTNPGSSVAYCRVYYNEIVQDEDFYLDVVIDKNSLKDKDLQWYTESTELVKAVNFDASKQYIPVPYTGEKTVSGMSADTYYPLRVMNKCAIVEGTLKPAEGGLEQYPAANAKTRSYNYPVPEVTKSGFTHIDGNYYFYDGSIEALGTEPCVFIADDKDRFLQGAYTSYSFGASTEEYKYVEAFRDNYKKEHQEGGKQFGADNSATAIYIYSNNYGSTYVYGENNRVTFNFRYYEDCYLYYNYNGNTCKNHKYVYGTKLTKEQIVNNPDCKHLVPDPPAGYEIVWYIDGERTQPVPEDGFEITYNRTLYGALRQSLVNNKEYIFYEMADPVTIDDVVYKYVTPDNIDAIKAAGKMIVPDKVSDIVTIEGAPRTVNTITYTLNGAVVMVECDRPTLSFTELKLRKDTPEYTDFSGKSYEEAYGKSGFYYDEKNKDNRSYGYVNSTPLILKVYFARNKYQVTVDPNISEADNPEIKPFSIDQHVILEKPVRDGYTFDHWSWEREDEGKYIPYTPVYDTENSFKMPAYNLKATAIWSGAEYSQKVYHYFQSNDQVFDSSFLSNIKSVPSEKKTVVYNGVEYADALVYEETKVIKAVEIVIDGVTYYFNKASVNDDIITVEENNLTVAVSDIDVTSEQEFLAETGCLTGFDLYEYSYTSVKSGKTRDRYNKGQKYTAEYGMTVEHYYTRSANYKIRLRAVCADTGAHGLTLTGEGEHFYGEKVTMNASLSSGYDFLGWYNAADVLKGYSGVTETPLDSYALIDDFETKLESLTPVSKDKNYTMELYASADYIAVSKPSDIVIPTLTINGKTLYTYGYSPSADNYLQAIAVVDASAGSGAGAYTKVTGYQWYEIEAEFEEDGKTVKAKEGAVPKPLTDENSSAFIMKQGMNAGPYLYKCEVTYERTDNGRSGTISKEQSVIIAKANMTVTLTGYSKDFDNDAHSIKVDVEKPEDNSKFIIYYNKDTALDKDNYDPANGGIGTTVLPEYINVNSRINDKTGKEEACAHTTYVYIKDLSGNYNDYVGKANVDIKPKQINVKVKVDGQTFQKMYDANTKVAGDLTKHDNEMYDLANGNGRYYELVGFIEDDEKSNSYLLACDAEFNDYHVQTAKSFSIKNLHLVYPDTGKNTYDYIFPSDVEGLTFSGNIYPRPVSIEWDEKSVFTYNGELQAPEVHFAKEQAYEIPEADEPYLGLTVTGKQVNIGEYKARAAAAVLEGGDFYSSDYTFDNLSKDYSIVGRGIKVVPKEKTVTYDGTGKTITEYTIVNPDTDEEDEVVSQNFNTSAVSNKSYTNAGTYNDIKMQNLVISDASGKDVTYNYEIFYETGKLVIEPAKVVVSGITADEKDYDGTDSVVIHGDNVTFAPHYSQNGVEDELGIDISKVTAHYVSSAAGTKTVSITIPNDALTGAAKDNYVVDDTKSQTEYEGLIRQSAITVTAKGAETVYGEEAPFDCAYTNIVNAAGETGTIEDINCKGEPVYLICIGSKDNEADWVEYVPGETGVGSYPIRIDVSGLEDLDNNFNFVWGDSEESVLTVTARLVSITDLDEPVTKTYDGTTVVKTTPVKGTNYGFSENDGTSKTGVLEKDKETLKLVSFDKIYNSKDVSACDKVLISNAVLNDTNYELTSEDAEIAGKITPAKLTITAEEKTIEYGETSPEYKAAFDGFITVSGVTETEEELEGSLSFSNARYNPDDKEWRNHGIYENDIIPGGYGEDGSVNGNYEIKYVPADLIVEQATIVITPDDKELSYKTGNLPADNIVNDLEGLPIYTYAKPDWKYEGDYAYYDMSGIVMPRVDNDGNAITKLTVPGEYPIHVNTVDDLENGEVLGITFIDTNDTKFDNYIFTAGTGKLTVIKHRIVINGSFEIPDKVYDGTTKVKSLPLVDKITDIVYTEIDDLDQPEKPADGLNLQAMFDLVSYEDKNVGNSIRMVIDLDDMLLSDYLRARYVIDQSDTHLSSVSSITKRTVFVKAKDQTIYYGDTLPANSVEEYVLSDEEFDSYESGYNLKRDDKESNFGLVVTEEGSEDFTTEFLFNDPSEYTYLTDYSSDSGSYSNAGEYRITPQNISGHNYRVVIADGKGSDGKGLVAEGGTDVIKVDKAGTLTVLPSKLSSTTPQWDSTRPGTVTWQSVTGIGDVEVAGYKVSLYNGTNLVKEEACYAGTEIDFSSVIRDDSTYKNAGGGQYTVKVTAIASKVNNTDNMNVADSDTETTDTKLYATKVTPEYSGDVAGAKEPVTINGKESYVIIAGEEAVTVKAVLNNSTGYTVESTGDSPLSLGSDSFNAATSVYELPVSCGASATPPANTKVVVKLTARKASLVATFSVDKNVVTYGFRQEDAPKFTANVGVDTTVDNIGTDGYTYSYKWEYIKGNKSDISKYTVKQENDSNEYSLDNKDTSGSYIGAGRDHYVKCTVTATRIDNGETVTLSAKAIGTNETTINIWVNKGNYNPGIAFKDNIDTWTYGDSRGSLKIVDAADEVTDSDITYKFADSPDAVIWSEKMPTDVGTYYVKAEIMATANFSETETAAIPYTINKAQLTQAENLEMTPSPTAPYGLVKWDAVEGPKENNGAADDSDSFIKVKYEVKFTYVPENSGVDTIIETVITEDTEYDFTDYIVNAGVYHFTVTPLVDADRADQDFEGQDIGNCSNGPSNTKEAIITIGAEITSNGERTTNPEGFTRVYDGTPMTITAHYSDAGNNWTYQWLKNGEVIPGATGDTISLTYVEENATFVCHIVQSDGESLYSRPVKAVITPRKISVITGSDSKVYDGTPLTKNSKETVSFGENKLASGDDFSITVTGTATYVSDTKANNNTYEDLVITRTSDNDKVVYAKDGLNNNYEIVDGSDSLGTLTINQRPLVVKPKDVTETYNAEEYSPVDFEFTNDTSLAANDEILSDNISFTGSRTLYGETATEISKIIITDSTGQDVTANYDITKTAGKITVNKRSIKIKTGSASKTYDGTPLTKYDGYSLIDGTTFAGTGDDADKITSITFSGTQTEEGSSDNTVSAITISNKDNVDVTECYSISYEYGTLTISSKVLTVTAGSDNKEYDGTPLTCGTFTNSDLAAGDVIAVVMTSDSTITHHGSVENKIEKVTITRNGQDVTASYSITPVSGLLTINQKPLALKPVNVQAVYDGKEHVPSEYEYTEGTSLITGDEVTAISYQGTRKYHGNTNSSIVENSVVIKNAEELDVTDDYEISLSQGTIVINKRPVTITGSSAEAKYDPAKPLTSDAYELSVDTPLAEGDKIVSVTVTGSQEVEGESDNVPSAAVITDQEDADVTENYDISYVNGKLTVSVADRFVKAKDLTITYDGKSHSMNEIIASTNGDGQLIYTATLNGEAADEILKPGVLFVTITGPKTDKYSEASIVVKLKIVPRKITIVADSATKVYDGSPLIRDSWQLVGSLAKGDKIDKTKISVVSNNGNGITAPGTCDNVVIIKTKYKNDFIGNGTENVTDCYNIVLENGTLTVTEPSDGGISPEEPGSPNGPGGPDQPGTPDNPNGPNTPANPEKPVNPDNPGGPNVPANPEKPGKPGTPEKPAKPDNPEEPGKPGDNGNTVTDVIKEVPIETEVSDTPSKDGGDDTYMESGVDDGTFNTGDYDENDIDKMNFHFVRCYWHWIILILLILSELVALLWWKKAEEDDEEEEDEEAKTNREAANGSDIRIIRDNEEDDDKKERRKVRRKGHFVLIFIFNGLGAVVWLVFGACSLEMIFEFASIIITAITEILFHNFNSKKKESDSEEVQNNR